MASYATPTGGTWEADQAGHVALWRWWRRLLAVAVPRGEGVSVDVDCEGDAHLRTVYAPLWEAHDLVIGRGGEFCWASEQSAPDVPDLPDEIPIPFGEPERDRFPERDLTPAEIVGVRALDEAQLTELRAAIDEELRRRAP